jgi:hypothetical protein
MTYGYQGFWTEVKPIFNDKRETILLWHYEIFTLPVNELLFDGYGSDCASALATAQAHIEALARGNTAQILKAA